MTYIKTDALIANVESDVADATGTFTTLTPVEAFLGTMAEAMMKQHNRIESVSSTLVSGTAGTGVAIATAAVSGLYQGIPFKVSGAAAAISGTPGTALGSAMNTGTTQIRKIGVALSLGDVSALTSGVVITAGTMTFVLGSTASTASLGAPLGSESAFADIPTPKFGPGHIPVGILQIPNDHSSGDGLTAAMMTFNLREIYGYDFTKIIGTPVQP